MKVAMEGDGPAALRAAARLGYNKLRKYQRILLQKDVYLFATGA